MPASAWPGIEQMYLMPSAGTSNSNSTVSPAAATMASPLSNLMSCSIVPVLTSVPEYIPAVAITSDGAKANSVATNSTLSPGATSADPEPVSAAAGVPDAAPLAPPPPVAPAPSGASVPHAAAATTSSAATPTLTNDRMYMDDLLGRSQLTSRIYP